MSNEIVYVCERCGDTFTLTESKRWICDGDVVTVCPNCGSDYIEEGARCKVCGEIRRMQDVKPDGVCKDCFADAVSAYKALFEYLAPWQREALEDEYGTIDITEE